VSMRSSGRFTGFLDSASPAYPEQREMTVCVKPVLVRDDPAFGLYRGSSFFASS
jgi:hypothetical protein